jgi:YgiT-type zinc finger domain-containing protein
MQTSLLQCVIADAEDRIVQGAMNMKCPVCGAAELIHDTRDLSYTYKGETTSIPAVTGYFCTACAESILDATESDRVMRELRDRGFVFASLTKSKRQPGSPQYAPTQ